MKVLVTDRRHASLEEEKKVLEPLGVEVVDGLCQTEEDLINKGRGAVGFLVSYAQITERVMKALPDLSIIVKYGVGVDNIDLGAARRLGKYVANVPDYSTEEVALQALSLLLVGLRKACYFGGEVRSRNWIENPDTEVIYRLSSQNLGLVGFGRIARKLGFFMESLINKIYFYDPYIKELPDKSSKYQSVESLPDVFSQAKLVSIHAPLNPTTRGMIDKNSLSQAKEVILVNTSRADIIDRLALEEALNSQKVIFYGADVFWGEPPNFQDPWVDRFIKRKDVLITPHVGWYSIESEKDLRRKAAEEVVRVIKGDKPLNLIN
ncbi:MAG: C-terminal binding protein [Candidatus Atribacteria bacterium]|nr:C-terminal binding protein [Candidatus Atribacteria bacterium]